MDLRRLRVTGRVQGVGFRPFVYRAARTLGLTGCVGNDVAGVWIDVCGPTASLEALAQLVRRDAPHLAQVTAVSWDDAPTSTVGQQAAARGEFVVAPSPSAIEASSTLVPPDAALCDACRAEVLDPRNRRYRYPLISCTDCGPRFTIIDALPYDRPHTSLAHFPLCDACQREYTDPADRRFHAQPISCFDCGPTLRFLTSGAEPQEGTRRELSEHALRKAVAVLRSGGILAVKGLGGYHLACDARSPQAVATLRERKGRGDKPLAVLVRDMGVARELAEVGVEAERALTSAAGPIVLLPPAAHPAAQSLRDAVAPRTAWVGLMLPPTSLHVLLTSADPCLDALVLTSCNVSDEPICIDDHEVLSLDGLWDGVLTHDRPIRHACDDSVLVGRTLQPVRLSRGYVPYVLDVPSADALPTAAVGGEMKAAVCLLEGGQAWLGPHLGEASSYSSLQRLASSVDALAGLRGVRVQGFVADAHPGYHSTRWARDIAAQADTPCELVQHHHAHLASLLAEHQVQPGEQALGVVFDGTGYGNDATIWGGEFLLGSYAQVERVAHLATVPLPGGDAAIRHPSRVALAHLWAAGEPWESHLPPVRAQGGHGLNALESMLRTGSGCTPTSSVGRLVDAVSALAGLVQTSVYEAQAAMELEAAAWAAPAHTEGEYPFPLIPGSPSHLDPAPLIRAVRDDALAGTPAPVVAVRFHRALAQAVVQVAHEVRERTGVRTVGLTGGVFLNAYLTLETTARLHAMGFHVLTHRLVPPSDGGLALGQAVVARYRSSHASPERRLEGAL